MTKKVGVVVKKEVKYTDIVHEMKDGVMCDVFMDGNKVVKIEVSKE